MDGSPEQLREKAERYRQMANQMSDQQAAKALRHLADCHEALALQAEQLAPQSAARRQ